MLEDGLGWVTESFFSLAPIHPYPTIAHHSPRGKGAKVAAETLVLLAQESWESRVPRPGNWAADRPGPAIFG